MGRTAPHPLWRTLPLLLLVLLLQGCSGKAPTRAEVQGPDFDGFRKTSVVEPIFNSRTYMVEGGPKQAKTVVLIHGAGDMGVQTWRHLLPALAKQYHVLAFDLPGFGRSEHKDALYSPAQYAAFVKWIVDNYVEGPFILLGHSLGGAIALYYAGSYHPKPERLVLADVAGLLHRAAFVRQVLRPHTRKPWPLSTVFKLLDKLVLSSRLAPRWLENLVENERYRSLAFGSEPAKMAAMSLIETDFGPLIHGQDIPTLLLWGEQDRVTPLRTGILLQGVLKRARLRTIAEAGHVPMLEQPEPFAAAVLDFLQASEFQAPPAMLPGSEVISCRDQTDLTLSGSYKSIRIANCKNITLKAVAAESIAISDSTVTIERAVIAGRGSGLTVRNSQVTATALSVEADHAVDVSASSLDLAGTQLSGRKTAVRSEDRATLILSVSHLQSPLGCRYIHDKVTVYANSPL